MNNAVALLGGPMACRAAVSSLSSRSGQSCGKTVLHVSLCSVLRGHVIVIKTVSQLLAGGFLMSCLTGDWVVPRPFPTFSGELSAVGC